MIGIDLGTTNSLVCVWEEDHPRLLENSFGEKLTPSVVSFDEDGTVYVGKTARERLVTHPETTFREFKRDMGTDARYTAYGREYTPEELSALVLKQLKADAEHALGHPVGEAVISVPAYFNDRQRAATRNAGLLAGLKVERLINEPSAAALAYHVDRGDEEEMFIVFDFGGGTLDVSLVDAFENVIEIQGISGDNRLGGKDFNTLIAYDICSQNHLVWKELSRQEKAILLREAEQIKLRLTDSEETTARVRLKGKEYAYTLSNQQLVDLSADLFSAIQKVLSRLMNNGMVTEKDISRVIMVGGSSKMPTVRQFVSRLFGGRISEGGNPDEIICQGTGILCGIKERKSAVRDLVLTDICPFTLGVGVKGDVMSPIIRKNQSLPGSRIQQYVTIEDNQKLIHFNIYQGENHKASLNLSLAEIEIVIPPRPAGEIKVEVRFSYDINGLFDIDVFCPETGEHIRRELGMGGGMSREEFLASRAALEKIKVHPRDMEQNKCILEKAEAVYVECNERQQAFLGRAMECFLAALDRQQPRIAERAYRIFQVQLAMVENALFHFDAFDEEEWDATFEDPEEP